MVVLPAGPLLFFVLISIPSYKLANSGENHGYIITADGKSKKNMLIACTVILLTAAAIRLRMKPSKVACYQIVNPVRLCLP